MLAFLGSHSGKDRVNFCSGLKALCNGLRKFPSVLVLYLAIAISSPVQNLIKKKKDSCGYNSHENIV